MDFSKKKQALLYLDRNGFYYYEAGFTKIISLGFLETSVKNLDVIDEKSLENQIQLFTVQNKLTSSSVTIIISPHIIFEKNIDSPDPAFQKVETDKFLDTVPFMNVATYNYATDKGIKVIGINEDLYLAIKNAFEKLGFVVTLILPYHSLGPDMALINNFTTENLSILVRKLDRLRQFNLLHVKIQSTTPETTQATSEKPILQKAKANIRVFVMGGFLIVLIIVLIFMVINMT